MTDELDQNGKPRYRRNSTDVLSVTFGAVGFLILVCHLSWEYVSSPLAHALVVTVTLVAIAFVVCNAAIGAWFTINTWPWRSKD